MDGRRPFSSPEDRRRGARVLLACLAVLGLLRWAELAKTHIPFPMDLFIETPNVLAVGDVREGRGLYSRANMEGPPFHILPYTPLFHLLTAALPGSESNPFLCGRLVSGFFSVAAVCFFGWLGRRWSWPSLAAGAATFIMIDCVSLTTFRYESAPLGLFLSLAAVACISRGGVGAAALSGALCAMAFLSKHTHFAAAGALGLFLLWRKDFRRAAAFTAACGGLTGAALGALTWLCGEGFWISTFGFLGNPFSMKAFAGFLAEAMRDPMLIAVLATAAALLVRGSLAAGAAGWLSSPRPLYAAVSLAIALLGLRSEGGGINYFVEPAAASLLLALERLDEGPSRPPNALWLAAMLAIAAGKVALQRPLQYAQLSPSVREQYLLHKAAVADEMASLGLSDPVVLNLTESPNGLLLSPRVLMSDVNCFSPLWRRGVVSMAPLLAALDRKAFDVVVLPAFVTADRPARHPHLEPLRAKVFETYAVARRGVFTYLRPKRP